MTEWKNQQQRQTAIQAMKILSRKRIGRAQLVQRLEKIGEKESNKVYKTRSNIKETIKKLENSKEHPIKLENNLLTRKDIKVNA